MKEFKFVSTEAMSRSADTPLRQGDVIEATASESSPWTRYLLVITADCDLANTKNAGRVTCVPLLTTDDYLLEFHFPERLGLVVERHVREFNDELRRNAAGPISPERVVEWVAETEIDEILRDLDLPQKSGERIRAAYDGIRLACIRSTTVTNAIENLMAAQRLHHNPQGPAKLAEATRNSIVQRFKSPPGDALFLGMIAPGYDAGYFAYLRHIEQVWEPQIALAMTREPRSYRRIGALSDRFTHAVVQRFAMVFMPIGLPAEYEEGRDRLALEFGRLVP